MVDPWILPDKNRVVLFEISSYKTLASSLRWLCEKKNCVLPRWGCTKGSPGTRLATLCEHRCFWLLSLLFLFPSSCFITGANHFLSAAVYFLGGLVSLDQIRPLLAASFPYDDDTHLFLQIWYTRIYSLIPGYCRVFLLAKLICWLLFSHKWTFCLQKIKSLKAATTWKGFLWAC